MILLRDAGIDISRATIDGWVMRVGDLLMPLVAVMGRDLSVVSTSRPMRRRWMCRHAMVENFAGVLQTDAYAAYDRVGGPKMVHAACWAHSRRRFVEAIKLNRQDVASTRIVAQMAKLFAIDAQARDENMNYAARHALRMERAPSVLSELKAQIGLPAERHSHRAHSARHLPTPFGCGVCL